LDTSGRPGDLYYRIAKDFSPKVAAMNICLYIEGLAARITALEAAADTGELAITEIQMENGGLAARIMVLEEAAKSKKPRKENTDNG
jgi:hypothetical protein